MMMNTTLDQLRGLKLESLAQALEQQLNQAGMGALSFEERLALLVDSEVHRRADRRCARLMKLSFAPWLGGGLQTALPLGELGSNEKCNPVLNHAQLL